MPAPQQGRDVAGLIACGNDEIAIVGIGNRHHGPSGTKRSVLLLLSGHGPGVFGVCPGLGNRGCGGWRGPMYLYGLCRRRARFSVSTVHHDHVELCRLGPVQLPVIMPGRAHSPGMSTTIRTYGPAESVTMGHDPVAVGAPAVQQLCQSPGAAAAIMTQRRLRAEAAPAKVSGHFLN